MDDGNITTLEEYQAECKRTWTRSTTWDLETQILNASMGMAGEAGEVIDHYKKVLFHGHELDRDKLIEETGDVMWYVAAMATSLGISLEEIATVNINKLKARYPEKFENDLSINRSE